MRIEGLRKDLAIGLILFALSLIFFWPVTLGGKTMLPADNAFEWEPWKSFAPQLGVGVPHNSLLSDLYLQNYVWKRFIVNSLRARQIPLWNPYILAGVPFLAAGQHSAMYPLSILFYVLPIPMAYGWFAALHIFLAGLFTYILARTLRISRVGGTIAAVTFMFCGFMVTHNVFPMIIASVVWLPLILALIERLVKRAEQTPGHHLAGYIPELACGSLAFGMVFLAGHPEMYYYVCLTSGAFALWRLAGLWRRGRSWLRVAAMAGGLLMMVGLGAGLGSAQWVPLFDVVRYNFREGSATFKQVLGWAYPLRHIVALFIPDFYGNPTHHTYFDLFTRRIVPVTVDARGQPINTIFWGIKNYVEGASYLGLLPTLLAVIALFKRKGGRIGFFALLALVSILFVFGNPLYIVVYKLPGLNQVHSPFRWIYPYSLSMAILAGMGLDALWHKEIARGSWQRLLTWLAEAILPKLALVGGFLMLVGLGMSLPIKERMAALAEWALHRLALAENAFADGRMFYSYEFRNLLIFALALFLSGSVLFMRPRFRSSALWGVFVALVTLGELFVIGKSFLPAVDPSLIAFRPPAIEFLKRDTSLYRVTSFVGSEKPLNANSGMFYDIQDVRGYDSIIPKQYVEMMRLIQEQSELQYNRIAPIFVHHLEALDAPLIDMLNVKYVLTTKERQITNRGYKLVYEGELRIYQNEEALPRAFLVPKALTIPDVAKRHEVLRSFDPRQIVILEEEAPAGQAEGTFGQVEAIDYGANEVIITFNASMPCFLVLGDSYDKGWLAFIRPPDAPDPTLAEQRLHIYRANGNFRAVHVPAGRHIVRFKYSPNAVKYGFYLSFLAGIMLMLGLGSWAWLKFYSRPLEEATAQRVTRNTVTPITLSLVNKVIDMAFAMLMLRILGDANAGRLYYAIVVIGWFDILTNFGLNTLLTREVAKDRARANAYLSNTTIARMGLCALSVPILGLFFALRGLFPPRLEPSTVLAIWLFGIGLVPSNVSAGLSAVLMAYERMEMPAFVTTITTVLKVSLQTAVLILTKSYVGLAATSIVVNLITMLILYILVRITLFRPRLEVDWGFQRRMLREAYPLMINSLLATLFFKVAVLLLEGLVKDDRVVGWYSAAYKYLDAVGVIPAYFTMAIFPLMARYAATAKGSLLKAYRLAIKLLMIIAVPGALVGWALSKELITILGGSQYLPYAANILQVMVWYMPIGFINSVTQYVLIALEQQRFLTRAFAIGLGFNIVANVVLMSRFGFMAAGYVAVISELVLFIPFYVGIRKHLSAMPWLQLAWKQILCAAPLALLCILLPCRFLPLSILVGLACYVAGLASIGVFDQEEREAVQRVIPLNRIRNRIAQTFMRGSVPS